MLSCFYEKDPEELVQGRDSLPGVGAVEHPCFRCTGVYIAVLQNDPVGLPVGPQIRRDLPSPGSLVE